MKGDADRKASKMILLLTAPIRVLRRARDLYVKTLLDCTSVVEGYNGGVVLDAPVTIKPRIHAGEEAAKELIGATRLVLVKTRSGRLHVETVDGNKLLCLSTQGGERRSGSKVYGGHVKRRNHGVGMGKIGRIDEDRACSFEEEDRS